MVGLFYIFAFKYPGGIRYHGFILIIILFPDKSNILLLLTTSLDPQESQRFGLLYKVDKVFGYGPESLTYSTLLMKIGGIRF
jgi:hypothetical protein